MSRADHILTEAVDPVIKKIGDAAKGQTLIGFGKELEKLFPKKDLDFVTSPMAMHMIKYKGKKIVVTHKKNVDGADLVVGDMAIGFLS